MQQATETEKIAWVNKQGQDVYARTTKRWARVHRLNGRWVIAKGFAGDIQGSYVEYSSRKSLGLTIAESWVLDN